MLIWISTIYQQIHRNFTECMSSRLYHISYHAILSSQSFAEVFPSFIHGSLKTACPSNWFEKSISFKQFLSRASRKVYILISKNFGRALPTDLPSGANFSAGAVHKFVSLKFWLEFQTFQNFNLNGWIYQQRFSYKMTKAVFF